MWRRRHGCALLHVLWPWLCVRPSASLSCSDIQGLPAGAWTTAIKVLRARGDDPTVLNKDTWGDFWAALGRSLSLNVNENLYACPEGTLVSLLHALPSIDALAGDAKSLEIIKLVHHHLSSNLPAATEPSEWQRHWLAAVASLLRFVYLKWVNVAQDGKDTTPAAAAQVLLKPSLLTKHHSLLFRTHVDAFQKRLPNLELVENSVYFSEAFAFVAFCKLHGVTSILESGVYRGFSTEVWSLFAEEVIGVDAFPNPDILRLAQKRLEVRGNVGLMRGEGERLLPLLLKDRADERVAIFIDGPKGELAIRLALRLREYPQVAFVAMHDMAPYRTSLQAMGAYFFSDEPWFQDEYGFLDEPFRRRPDIKAGGTMAFIS